MINFPEGEQGWTDLGPEDILQTSCKEKVEKDSRSGVVTKWTKIIHLDLMDKTESEGRYRVDEFPGGKLIRTCSSFQFTSSSLLNSFEVNNKENSVRIRSQYIKRINGEENSPVNTSITIRTPRDRLFVSYREAGYLEEVDVARMNRYGVRFSLGFSFTSNNPNEIQVKYYSVGSEDYIHDSIQMGRSYRRGVYKYDLSDDEGKISLVRSSTRNPAKQVGLTVPRMIDNKTIFETISTPSSLDWVKVLHQIDYNYKI